MRKVLYTKFSRERRNEFQIMTRITEEDGIRRVWKLSLQKEGELHIRHMYENYRKLEHLYTYAGVQICPCELDEEKCALAFPFVEGESLETRISRHGKEKDFASLKKDYELLYQIIASAKGQKSFVETDAFCEVFGHPALKEGLAAAEISNIDMIPGNLLLDGEKVWVADYEWVFPFAVPIAFIYARSVFFPDRKRIIVSVQFSIERGERIWLTLSGREFLEALFHMVVYRNLFHGNTANGVQFFLLFLRQCTRRLL